MSSVNKVILVGNLGKDPEIRHTQDGRPIANLSVAASETAAQLRNLRSSKGSARRGSNAHFTGLSAH